MSLPLPGLAQAYCDISALESGSLLLPLALFITNNADPHALINVPSLSFLLEHSENKAKMVFDLGIRKDWESSPPRIVELVKQNSKITIEQDVVDSLARGGISPMDIPNVCLSHCHFDHVGNTALFPNSTFLVGAGSADWIKPGYPIDPESTFASDLLPPSRTQYLDASHWPSLGPFPHALDYYGDGSLYIVDAPGHCPGHLNILARTSSDGAWIYLAGDSAHHWDIITGLSEISVHGDHCAHEDKGGAEEHIRKIRDLRKIPRVQVLLAHDEPWYNSNKGGPAFWPGKIQPM